MPVADMHFQNGIFYARQFERISRDDAHLWVDCVAHYAAKSATPIVGVVNALDVTFITTEARQLFVRASKIPNFRACAIVSRDPVVLQTIRIVARMAQLEHTHIFSSIDEALYFAQRQLNIATAG